MAFVLRNIARHAVKKIATDPEVRKKAAKAAKAVAKEVGEIAREKNKAYAFGWVIGRALHKLEGK